MTRQDRDGSTRRRFLRGAAAAGTAGAIAGCTDLLGDGPGNRYDVDGWPTQFRDAGNTAYAPDVSGPRDGLELQFKYLLEDDPEVDLEGVTRYSTPVIADGRVFVYAQGTQLDEDGIGRLITLDLETGERVWTSRSQYEGFNVSFGEAVVDDGTVVHTGERVRGLDAESGDEEWTRELETGLATYDDDTVFLLDQDSLYALDVGDGSERWSIDVAQHEYERPAVDDVVVVLSEGNVLAAYDRSSGEERWRTEHSFFRTHANDGNPGDLDTPTLGDDTVYVAGQHSSTDHGGLAAFDRTDGNRRWTFDGFEFDTGPDGPGPGNVKVGLYGSPALAQGTLYVTGAETTTNYLYAIDADTGDLVWRTETDAGTLYPSVDENAVYTAGTQSLVAIDREDGSKLDQFDLDPDEYGRGYGGPYPVVDDTVLVGTRRGVIGVGK